MIFTKIILLSIISFLIACNTGSEKTKNDEIKYLSLCPKNIVGCADRIHILDKSYLIDPQNEKVRDMINKAAKDKRSDKEFIDLIIFDLAYTTAREKGRFPNPMAEFDVIKVENISF